MQPDDCTRQIRIEIAAIMVIVVMLMANGFVFIISDNVAVLALLADNGLVLSPLALAEITWAGAAAYALLLMPLIEVLSKTIRRTLFLVFAFPIVLYMTTLGAILLRSGLTIGSLLYLMIYVIIFWIAFAVYDGYSRLLETLVIVTMITIFLLGGVAFLEETPLVLRDVGVNPFGFVLLCFASSIAYSGLLHPRIHKHSLAARRSWFLLAEAPIAALITLYVANPTSRLTNWSGGLVAAEFLALIAMLAVALYRPCKPRAENQNEFSSND